MCEVGVRLVDRSGRGLLCCSLRSPVLDCVSHESGSRVFISGILFSALPPPRLFLSRIRSIKIAGTAYPSVCPLALAAGEPCFDAKGRGEREGRERCRARGHQVQAGTCTTSGDACWNRTREKREREREKRGMTAAGWKRNKKKRTGFFHDSLCQILRYNMCAFPPSLPASAPDKRCTGSPIVAVHNLHSLPPLFISHHRHMLSDLSSFTPISFPSSASPCSISFFLRRASLES